MITLKFIYMDGCGACEAAKPHLRAWAARRKDIRLIMHDALKDKWTETWEIKATPTYVLSIPGLPETMYEGSLSTNDIDV